MLEVLAEPLKAETGLTLTVHRKTKLTGGEDQIAIALDAVVGASDPAVLGSLIKVRPGRPVKVPTEACASQQFPWAKHHGATAHSSQNVHLRHKLRIRSFKP